MPPRRQQQVPSGKDASTQVSPEELFDFERDAAPAVRDLVAAALQAVEVEAAEGLRLEALCRRRQLQEVRTRMRNRARIGSVQRAVHSKWRYHGVGCI